MLKTWALFTKRTDDPKLSWIEGKLRFMGIPSRRNGYSWHALILEVPQERLAECQSMLAEPVGMGDGTTVSLDDIDDDDPMFLEPY